MINQEENFIKKGEALIHETSQVFSENLGKGSVVFQFCLILERAIIGNNCNINFNVLIENDVIIGDNVTVKSGVQLWDGLLIEDNVFIGPNVTFTNDLLPRSKQYPQGFLKTLIKMGASIGANATIIAGNTIGEYSMIGAGSVLTKNVGKNELWVGNPAKHVGYVTKDGNILGLDLIDKRTKQKYKWDNNNLLKQ